MPRPTPTERDRPTQALTTRHFYVDLLERLRVLAAVDGTTIEDEINYLVELGLATEAARRAQAGVPEGGRT